MPQLSVNLLRRQGTHESLEILVEHIVSTQFPFLSFLEISEHSNGDTQYHIQVQVIYVHKHRQSGEKCTEIYPILVLEFAGKEERKKQDLEARFDYKDQKGQRVFF